MISGKLSVGALLGMVAIAGACSGSKAAGGTTGAGGAGGVAGGAPKTLVSAPGCGNIRLVVSNGTIYYTNHLAGTVSSVAVAGGAPTVLATAQNKPNPIAVDATSVYWGNDGDKTVLKQALAGGPAAVILPAPTDPDPDGVSFANALLVDGTTLYVGRGYDTYKMSTSGGAATHLSSSPVAPTPDKGIPGAFALDPTHLYQVEINHNAVSRETLDGTQDGLLSTGTAQALAPDRIAVSRAGLVHDAVAISGQQVVWANLNGIEVHDKDKTETQSTLSLVLNSAGFNAISGFVISGGKLYLGETGDNNVQVAPLVLTGVDPLNVPSGTVIATNQANPAEFAADATNIYFTTIDSAGACTIQKLAK